MAERRPSGDGMVYKWHDGCWKGRIVVGHKENDDSIFRYPCIDQRGGRKDLVRHSGPAPSKPTHKGQRRKAGTGCVTQINEKLWEGRYSPVWPDGKKHARNVYAHSEEECEKLLAEMITEMKVEIAVEKKRLKADPKAG